MMCVKSGKELPSSCADHYNNGHTDNGIYTVFTTTTARRIYCHMTTQPWTTVTLFVLLLGRASLSLYTGWPG